MKISTIGVVGDSCHSATWSDLLIGDNVNPGLKEEISCSFTYANRCIRNGFGRGGGECFRGPIGVLRVVRPWVHGPFASVRTVCIVLSSRLSGGICHMRLRSPVVTLYTVV